MKFIIKNRRDVVLYEGEAETLRQFVVSVAPKGLSSADLRGADLRGAYLTGAKINWQSHALISEILRREAGKDLDKRKFAGLICVSTDWCWDKFIPALKSDLLFSWAMDFLRSRVIDGDCAPQCLLDWVVTSCDTVAETGAEEAKPCEAIA